MYGVTARQSFTFLFLFTFVTLFVYFGMQSKNQGIPNRWLFCPRRGNVVCDIFLPFKTPLDSRHNRNVDEGCRFTPEMMTSLCSKRSINLKCVIDLTNTTRYYNSKIFEDAGIKYFKLSCTGFGDVPNNEQVQLFKTIVNKQISDDEPNKNIVGVHCTHGFNRTGFLIICYMVEELGWDVCDAVDEFTKARPPGIYKQDYLDQLFERFAVTDVHKIAPETPDWSEETILSMPSVIDASSTVIIQEKEFHPLCPTVKQVVDAHEVSKVQQQVYGMCARMKRKEPLKIKGFAGSQSVSMTRENIAFLITDPYKVSWKADGTRYLVLINGPEQVYLLDRDNTVFQAKDVTFRYSKELDSHLQDTLVDAELVIDEIPCPKEKGNVQRCPRLLIFDAIVFNGQDVGLCDLNKRLLCIKRELVDPRNELVKRGKLDKTKEAFSVRQKDFFDVPKTRELWTKFKEQVCHHMDGLMFQPEVDPYFPGRCDRVLKWKPAEENSIDFRLRVAHENRIGELPTITYSLFVIERNVEVYFATMKTPPPSARKLADKIVECRFDFKKQDWVVMRERTDKSFPNAKTTALAVWNSIMNPVTDAALYEVVEKRSFVVRKRRAPSDVVTKMEAPPVPIKKPAAL